LIPHKAITVSLFDSLVNKNNFSVQKLLKSSVMFLHLFSLFSYVNKNGKATLLWQGIVFWQELCYNLDEIQERSAFPMKRILLLVFLIFLFCITTVPVSATPPSISRNYFGCYVQNAPADAVYFDLLIKITPQDKKYLSFNDQINTIPADSEIALYNQDGYMSLSFHYQDLQNANMEISSPWFYLNDSGLSMDKVSPTIKAVILDKDGNILQISEAVSTTPGKSEFAYTLTYDASQNSATIKFEEYSKNPYLLLYLSIPIRAVLAVGIGTLFAIPFKMRPIWIVSVVNLVMQIVYILLFYFAYFFFCIHLSIIMLFICDEILVFILEFTAYFLIYHSIPKWKIAVHPLITNMVSLFMVLLIFTIKVLIQSFI